MWTGFFYPTGVMQKRAECRLAKDRGNFHDMLFVHGVHEPGIQELYATLKPRVLLQLPQLEKCHCLKDFSWPLEFWSQSMLDFAVTNLLEEIEGHLDGVVTIVCTAGAKLLVQTAVVEASMRARKLSRIICRIIFLQSTRTHIERHSDGGELLPQPLEISSSGNFLVESRFSRLHVSCYSDIAEFLMVGDYDESVLPDISSVDFFTFGFSTRAPTRSIRMPRLDRSNLPSNGTDLCSGLQYVLNPQDSFGGDGHWILKTPEYQGWVLYEDSFLIWIQGEPGMGKSIMALAVLRSLVESRNSDYIVLFYSSNMIRTDQAPEQSILLSFVHYALAQQPHLQFEPTFQTVLREIDQQGNRRMDRIQFRSNLHTIFSSMDPQARVFLVLDGLNPSDELEVDIISTLWPFGGRWITPLKPKIMALSRSPRPPLSFDMSAAEIDLNGKLTARLSLYQFASRYGSWELINATLKSLGAPQISFLWVILLEVIVRNGRALEILRELCRSRSASIWILYEALAWSIKPQHRPFAVRVLTWILYARRPLHKLELLTAIQTKTPSSPAPTSVEILGEAISTSDHLIHQLAGLLVERNGYVYLIHNTAKEFLLSKEANKPWANEHFGSFHANEVLAMGCLTYLQSHSNQTESMDTNLSDNTDVQERQLCGFATYAQQYWIEHYRVAQGRSEYLPGLVNRLLEKSFQSDRLVIRQLLSFTTSENLSLLICAGLGLLELVNLYLELGAEINVSPSGITPLTLAAKMGHYEVVKLLLSKSTPKSGIIRNTHRTALTQAAFHGHFDVCRVLLDSNPEYLRHSELLGEVLHSAVLHQCADVVQFLLDAGADPLILAGPSEETALHIAASSGFLEGCAHLLRCRRLEPLSLLALQIERLDFQPCMNCMQLKCPVSIAGEEPLRLRLRSYGRSEWQCVGESDTIHAQLTAKDAAGYSPLHHAASYGNLSVCQLLLDCGADLQAIGTDGMTPAGLARRYGYLSLADALESWKSEADSLNRCDQKLVRTSTPIY